MPHRADAKVDTYSSFADLAAHEVRGRDYDLLVRHRNGTRVVIIAPHGGGIEPETARIAKGIAGAEFSLYCFKGLKRNGNGRLHITSHSFDEPECLSLIAKHQWVLAIHGCADAGERVFLGGLDKSLIADLSTALEAVGIRAETSGHEYTGVHPLNICNRGARGAGAQFELSLPFRRDDRVLVFVETVRSVLAGRQNELETKVAGVIYF